MFYQMKRIKAAITVILLCGAGVPATAGETTFSKVGDALQIISPIGAMYVSYRNHGSAGVRACGTAIGTNFLATHALKRAINEPRPNGGEHGMPSGHTSSAAVGFGCVLGQEGLTPRAMAFGAMAVVTGASRVSNDAHSRKQVLAGFILGTAIGTFQTKHLREQGINYYASSSSGGIHVGAQISFQKSPSITARHVPKSERVDLIKFSHSLRGER